MNEEAIDMMLSASNSSSGLYSSTTGFELYSTMSTNDSYDYFNISSCPMFDKPISNAVLMVLYAVVCLIGLMGNTLVIYVVLRFSNMQTVTNMYILNLAIADECFLIGIPFLITTMHFEHWAFGTSMCKAYMVSTSITQFTSSIFLFIMSADRYIGELNFLFQTKQWTVFICRLDVTWFDWRRLELWEMHRINLLVSHSTQTVMRSSKDNIEINFSILFKNLQQCWLYCAR